MCFLESSIFTFWETWYLTICNLLIFLPMSVLWIMPTVTYKWSFSALDYGYRSLDLIQISLLASSLILGFNFSFPIPSISSSWKTILLEKESKSMLSNFSSWGITPPLLWNIAVPFSFYKTFFFFKANYVFEILNPSHELCHTKVLVTIRSYLSSCINISGPCVTSCTS